MVLDGVAAPGRWPQDPALTPARVQIPADAADTRDPMFARSALVLPVLQVLVLTAGCVHALPPRETPGPVEPPPAPFPPAPGMGRIYVDVVDGPTHVRVVNPITVTETVNGEQFEEEELQDQATCLSPCVLDLPLGSHLFAFPVRGAGGVDLQRVFAYPRPSVYRRALGWRQQGDAGFALGVVGAAFGGTSFVTGAALLPVGLATDSHGVTVAGGITLGVGALLTAAGIWAIANHPLSEQAGAGAQYNLPAGDDPR
jgi:hypothetical protein